MHARAGSSRLVDRLRIDPDGIRRQPPGSAWVIRRGRAARLRVTQAPSAMGVLPEAESTEPLPMPRPQAPKQVDYLNEPDESADSERFT